MKFPTDLFMHTEYFAPRGQERLMTLGSQIAFQHLKPTDKCIGILGQAGSGKSLLVRGLFPGLQLTNDDEEVYTRPLPLLDHYENGRFKFLTYHMDAKFEMAFAQPWRLAEAITAAIAAERRVVIEHFDLLAPALGRNADLLVGIGEEVVVVRPNLFGPSPASLARHLFASSVYRRMVHTAEDIICDLLDRDYQIPTSTLIHGDVTRGFFLEFHEKPGFSIAQLQESAQKIIRAGVPVAYEDETHIRMGERRIHCTGPRIHLTNTSDIKFFALAPEFIFHPVHQTWLLVGIVDEERMKDLNDINKF